MMSKSRSRQNKSKFALKRRLNASSALGHNTNNISLDASMKNMITPYDIKVNINICHNLL